MSYLVLARKYRPQSFDDVIGQEQITHGLKVALANNRVHHAYLFCGPRGTGKTTCARILARELNRIRPGVSCESLDLDSNLDIIEIDGASNRGIDEIRTLRENVQFVPMSGGYKVYIVDEVHMLTTEAFNALLKTLEEPPAHVKFIFATTDPNKLPLTVASRCQRCDFKRIPLELLVKNLRDIAQKEGFNVEEEALFSVAKAAQGSMRDALSVLDQLISYSDGEVKAADVNEMLGLVEFQYLLDLAEAVAAKDCSRAFEVLDALISRGKDVKQLTMNLIEHFRHLMVMKVGGDKLQSLVDHPKLQKEAIYRQAGRFTMHEIIHALEILVDAQDTARVTESARLALELALAQTMAAEIPSSASPRNIKAASETSSTLAGSRPAEPPSPASFKTVAKPAGQPTAQKNPLRAVPVEEPPASGFIKNNKGQIGVVSSAAVPEAVDAPKAEILEIDNIKRQWNALTHAVAQEKISTGTFLQEGYPLKVSGNIISVAFTREHAFHKECLAKHEVRDLVVKVFSAFLGIGVTVELVLVDGPLTRLSEEITEAREIFNGEIVNEWHSDE